MSTDPQTDDSHFYKVFSILLNQVNGSGFIFCSAVTAHFSARWLCLEKSFPRYLSCTELKIRAVTLRLWAFSHRFSRSACCNPRSVIKRSTLQTAEHPSQVCSTGARSRVLHWSPLTPASPLVCRTLQECKQMYGQLPTLIISDITALQRKHTS